MERESPEDALKADGSYVVGHTDRGKEFHTLAVRTINVEEKRLVSTTRRYINQVWMVLCLESHQIIHLHPEWGRPILC